MSEKMLNIGLNYYVKIKYIHIHFIWVQTKSNKNKRLFFN